MSGARFAVFLTIVLSVWALMHLYVFWRLGTIPWIAQRVSRRRRWIAALALGSTYFLARLLHSWGWSVLAVPLEWTGAIWIGVLFLTLTALLAVDAFTLGGKLWPRFAPQLRGGAVIVALILSIAGLVQGCRPPAVVDYEVNLKGLPPERDGLTLVVISDLHLGTLRGERWLQRVIAQVNVLHPDLVAVVGDLVDGNVKQVEPLLPVLRSLRAPLGVWAVTGNHEFYAGIDPSVRLLENAGYTVLRNRSLEVAPGLVLAGVDDLTARRQFGQPDASMTKALTNRPPGAAILLSHSPLQAEQAAAAGANLMLSGHTHNGQIWPFNYLVQTRYAYLGGRYEVDGMPLIVCRGTGTWGPPMRLWRPGEILRIRLRSAA